MKLKWYNYMLIVICVISGYAIGYLLGLWIMGG